MNLQHENNTEELWKNFWVVTQEMEKFIDQNNIEMFLSLLDQRLKLQELIEQAEDKYSKTEEGKALIKKIMTVSEKIQISAQKWVNKSRQNQTRAKAYDGFGNNLLNKNFNREY